MTPIHDSDLARLDALDSLREKTLRVRVSNDDPVQAQNVKVVCQLADAVPALLAEIRRLKLEENATGDGIAFMRAEAEEFRVQVREAFAARDEKHRRLLEVVDVAKEMLSHLRSGPVVHLPHAKAYALHVDVDVVARWEEILGPQPVPMCKPDPLEDIMPPTPKEGDRS